VGGDGYCTSCGHRALEPIAVDDRGAWASATHRGRRHERNEDAAALASTSEGWPVLVVADGVSTSPNPQLASAAAVAAAARRLAGQPFTGEADLEAAVVAAHGAACAAPAVGDPYWQDGDGHPACTIVVAVATSGTVVTANVGDARVYLLTNDGRAWTASQLTTDDSLAARAVAAGEDPHEALAAPGGHTLVAWLGADAPELAVHLTTHSAAPGDLLIATSDGLWNYAATDESLGELATSILPSPPATGTLGSAKIAEQLVAWAIAQGGADNISVALAPVPSDPGDPHAPDDEESP
jgi:serine/threonine protein phosphatase PrpC